MKCAMHQPNFIPWGGYFGRILGADLFILVDDVQFSHYSLTNRNRIKGPNGEVMVIVPVSFSKSESKMIKDIKIDYARDWVKKHLRTFEFSYRRSDHFNELFPILERAFSRRHQYLVDLNSELIFEICHYLGIDTKKIVYSSAFHITSSSTQRLVELCLATSCDTFIHGGGARKYVDLNLFREAGIKLQEAVFLNKPYPQLWGDFIPSLSIVDMLFNVGTGSLDYIQPVLQETTG